MNSTLKQGLSSLFRALGLMKVIDALLFNYSKIKNRNANASFRRLNPDIILPPDYMMYESFQINYHSYYFESQKSAQGIIDLAKPFININYGSILDWGCGPGRIVRHLPDILPRAKVFGSDYNQKTIDWCKESIEQVSFHVNGVYPPLDFKNAQMNYIYGISIFTHFSEDMHQKWIDELHRVLAKGGILMLTTHGNSFRTKLTPKEKRSFDAGQLVVRGNTEKGHRSYVAFHPEEYFSELVKEFELKAFKAGDVNALKPQQDIWVLRKS